MEKIFNFLPVKLRKYFRFLFFCFVGTTAAIIYIAVFNFFRFWVNFSFILSLTLAIPSSLIYNFSMNRNITFSAIGYSIKKQLPRYITVYATSISANFFTALFVKYSLEGVILNIALQENIALIAGIAVSIPISFFGSLLWTFKKNKNDLIIL